ncbi:dTDP-4-dehydrorhamnose reductase [Mesonia sp. K7]|uniref:dTDP-4-dehydrorhamnose reductase n=1 Tax=Mesonia sp. K7 TaxID=2218606 RepID=UPI000DA776A2|nr:dTDP-4-dehydrorhamnose reductase [Mesonia sp. K7]PZD79115.1 dTDP-4-dehydrorhamnose reductase [Mesonia sp. K7]
MKKVLVTGANGQLGKCLQKIAHNYPHVAFDFKNSQDLDITNFSAFAETFKRKAYDYCINCAAFTNVELAESEQEQAFLVNAKAVKNLAKACKENNSTLIHISTDYVFDGTQSQPYSETAQTNPINIYGASKLQGEEYIQEILEKFFIIRTSWLYSEFGHNFFKTIESKLDQETTFSITTEQTGTPTNAIDLAKLILEVISSEEQAYGLYHFSNQGETTWYGFAQAIVKLHPNAVFTVKPTDIYPTKAKRPTYSVLSKEKIIKTFNYQIDSWQESLKKLIKNNN